MKVDILGNARKAAEIAAKLRVDLYSDTNSKPTAGMRKAMAEAECGNEQALEDPTTNRLQERVAELVGKEAAVYLPSGTMCNEIAYRVWARQGDAIIMDKTGHALLFETGGPAALSGLMITTIDSPNGIFSGADVRAAERTLAAATARIGVAKADYFPQITLVGAVSASAQTLSGVGGDGSFGYGVGPSIAWSGFDIPRVRAQVKAADAHAEAAFAAYEQTVLVALEETRTALSAYGRERVRFNALNAAAATAREAASLARERFDAGADDFIDVLDAEGRQLAAEASLAESQSAVASRYINVYLALGAGWRSEPSIHEVKA